MLPELPIRTIYLLTLALMLSTGQTWAQTPDADFDCPTITDSSGIFRFADTTPIYRQDGTAGLVKFIAANLDRRLYRTKAGKVFVSFVVTASGEVRCPKVTKSLGPPYDAEAVRVASLFGPFIPGTKDGKPVAVQFTVPITFGNSAKPTPLPRR
ncbi:energy transducer TonB [Hymenobacter sp. B81]|uniref:energy transducer TonB n=1 Tax=Hymenobacter sp. B81 TaxID=3344878 RepID=UPI0037DD8EA2